MNRAERPDATWLIGPNQPGDRCISSAVAPYTVVPRQETGQRQPFWAPCTGAKLGVRQLNAKTGALLAEIGSSHGGLDSPGAELSCEMCSLAGCSVVCCFWVCLNAVTLCMAFNVPGTGWHSTTHRALALCNWQR